MILSRYINKQPEHKSDSKKLYCIIILYLDQKIVEK